MAQLIQEAAFLLLTTLLTCAYADPIPLAAAATTTTTTSNSFPTMVDPESQGSASPTADSTTAGADGADSGFKLSTGAIIGICITIAVIIVAFITLWALWFTAKRRNWAVRDTLKYASRRLTGRGAVPPTPRTPHTPHPARAGRGRAGGSNRGVTMYTGAQSGSRAAGRKADVERNGESGRMAQVPTQKPTAGWLAHEEEKSSSRSLTPSSRGGRK